MAKVSLSGMTVEALMDLRKRVDETLHKRRAELQKQLESMDRAIAVVGGRGRSALNEEAPTSWQALQAGVTAQPARHGEQHNDVT